MKDGLISEGKVVALGRFVSGVDVGAALGASNEMAAIAS
jgi:hypothetical protein